MRESRRHNVGAGSFPNAIGVGTHTLVGTSVERTVIGPALGLCERGKGSCASMLPITDLRSFPVNGLPAAAPRGRSDTRADLSTRKLPIIDDRFRLSTRQ